MRKEFKVGVVWESDTEYYATQGEYHVYEEDTLTVSDPRYVALRAHDTPEFRVFALIKNKKNITIDFGGATLVMHGKIQPFLIDSSENITLKNCNVTYARPPYTEMLITEVTPEGAKIRLNEHCPCRVAEGKLIPCCDEWSNEKLNYNYCFYQVFDPETCQGRGIALGVMGDHIVKEPDYPFDPQWRFTVEEGEDGLLLKGNLPPYYQPGRVLVIAHEKRSLSNVFAIDTKNLRLENYRILSGWGMGLYTYRTENIFLDGFRLFRDERSPCIVANAADALHSFGTSGVFEIRNSVFGGMIDDAINIHSNFRTVEHVCGNEIYSHLASCEKQAADLYRVGDEIAVYRGKTLEEVARYRIVAIEDAENSIKKFTVDRPVGAHVDGDLIENLTANCDVIIENCRFGKANSHLRLQSRGKFVLRNCETELPLLLSGDASFWFESGPVTDLTVENCRFVGERAKVSIVSEVFPTEKAPYYHRNLKILNCQFDTDAPLNGGYADGIVFRGNTNAAGKAMTVTLTNCGSADAENCTVVRKTEEKRALNRN